MPCTQEEISRMHKGTLTHFENCHYGWSRADYLLYGRRSFVHILKVTDSMRRNIYGILPCFCGHAISVMACHFNEILLLNFIDTLYAHRFMSAHRRHHYYRERAWWFKKRCRVSERPKFRILMPEAGPQNTEIQCTIIGFTVPFLQQCQKFHIYDFTHSISQMHLRTLERLKILKVRWRQVNSRAQPRLNIYIYTPSKFDTILIDDS